MIYKKYMKIFVLLILSIISYENIFSQGKILIAGGLSYENSVSPGNSYTGNIVIRNIASDSVLVSIYHKDYSFYYDGISQYTEPGTLPRSNSSWITFSPKQLYVPGESEININYVVKVPALESLTGTYWSMLMIEPVEKIIPEKKEGINVRTVIRYGIQIITNIEDTGSKEIEFLDINLIKDDKKRILLIDIENIGERVLKPAVWLDLYSFDGTEVGRFESKLSRTYPGTSIRRRIDLSSIEPGKYKAIIIADCGNDDLFGIDYTLEIE